MSSLAYFTKCIRCTNDVVVVKGDYFKEDNDNVYIHKVTLPEGSTVAADVDVGKDITAICSSCIYSDPSLIDTVRRYKKNKNMVTTSSLVIYFLKMYVEILRH